MIKKFFSFIFFLLIAALAVCGFFTYKYFKLKKEVAEKEKTPTTAIQYRLDSEIETNF